MANDPTPTLTTMLAEYKSLRGEIQYRTGAQNQIHQIHAAAFTLILGFLSSGNLLPWILFLVPIESSIFGLYFMDNAITINRIGGYIQTKIEPEVNTLLDGPILGWESGEGDISKSLPRHYVTFRWLLTLTYAGPSVVTLIASLALMLLSLPGIRIWLGDILGAGTVAQIPVFFAGLAWVLGSIVFAICLVFLVTYLSYAAYAFKLVARRAAEGLKRAKK